MLLEHRELAGTVVEVIGKEGGATRKDVQD